MDFKWKNRKIPIWDRVFPKKNFNKVQLTIDITEKLLTYKGELLQNPERLSRPDIKDMLAKIKKDFDPNLVVDLNLDSFFRGLYSVIVIENYRDENIEEYFDTYIETLPRRVDRLFNEEIKDFRDDEEFDELYRRDMNTSKIVNIFSGLAIFIACLGLFGLASHSTTQRIKEIGVRKVLGASVPLIIKLLVLDFIKWVALSNLFALPLAWYVSSQWLQGFAYRVELNLVPFVAASLAALAIAIITVLSQSWRAALLNPAKALRYE